MNSRSKKQDIHILLNFIFLAFFFCGGFFFGIKIKEIRSQNQQIQVNSLVGRKNSSFNKMDVFFEVWETVQGEYVKKEIDEENMVYGSIKGFIESLGDYYSAFYTPEETKEVKKQNAGKFEGIGVTLKYDGEYTVIESPFADFPAIKAGIQPGDIVLAVDGEEMVNVRPVSVSKKIKGEAGTSVEITIFRPSNEKVLKKEIVRGHIDIDNISYEELEGDIYQIKLIQFTESSLYEFKQNWNKVVEEIKSKNPKGIILDLRGNPGGYVDGAIHVADEFLPMDSTVLIEKNREQDEFIRSTGREGQFEKIPLVVLINKGSASSSEIVAGALRDHKRATLIGNETVGKGVEQKVINLSDGSTLHLVFKQWFTPNGQGISFEDPIKPDIQVDFTTEDFANKRDPQIEKALEVINN